MAPNIDIEKIRNDFPILKMEVHGKPLVYLDNAATTQKPQLILDAIQEFYSTKNSNIHRGLHHLSELASEEYENSREAVKDFICAKEACEIVFTQGTTDSINLVAHSFGDRFIQKGDEVIITQIEHHSNLIPWQIICNRKNARLRVLSIDEDGRVDLEELKNLLNSKTKLIAVTYVSNVLGMITPVEEIIRIAHEGDVAVLVDAAQAIPHIPIDVQKLGCDFLAFSGHKMYAETGIGVLYGREKWLREMPVYRSGGGMVSSVNFLDTVFLDPPLKFEAGTGNYVGAVSLKAAIKYIKSVGTEKIAFHEEEVYKYALKKLRQMPRIRVYGNSSKRCGAISFNLEDIHHYDAGMILDKLGIAVRTGTHCAEPLMSFFGVKGTVRASFALYNTKEEVDRLADGIIKVQSLF
jgi:cysteine desulfurase/selenocysteine lyase